MVLISSAGLHRRQDPYFSHKCCHNQKRLVRSTEYMSAVFCTFIQSGRNHPDAPCHCGSSKEVHSLGLWAHSQSILFSSIFNFDLWTASPALPSVCSIRFRPV